MLSNLAKDVQVTKEDLQNFKTYAQWASAAIFNDGNDPETLLACDGGGCPDITAAKAIMITPVR